MSGVIVAITLSDLEGVEFRFYPPAVAVWLVLVAAFAAGRQGARVALIAYGMLSILVIGVVTGKHRYDLGLLLLTIALAVQTAVLFWPSLRSQTQRRR